MVIGTSSTERASLVVHVHLCQEAQVGHDWAPRHTNAGPGSTHCGLYTICICACGIPSGVAVPTAFPGIRFSLSLLRVMSATASPFLTIVALDGSEP